MEVVVLVVVGCGAGEVGPVVVVGALYIDSAAVLGVATLVVVAAVVVIVAGVGAGQVSCLVNEESLLFLVADAQ